jgi:putative spermidine/putrescine transport system ATP-binding protein
MTDHTGRPGDDVTADREGRAGEAAGRAPLAVSVRDVSMIYDGMPAVDGASFDLAKGRFLTILGPSGCGKTTILRMIAGFLTPTSGEILINGRSVARVPPHRRSVGMVFQKLALFPHMTVAENVGYPLRMRRFSARDAAERVERYLALVRLEGFGARRIHELSGGQQQRVAIARALVFEPDLLLLDEPLAALDKKLREDMQLEFRRIQQELGVTTINVTHDQREAMVMSDHVLVMDRGRIQQAAAPEDTYHQPANRFVASFIGVTNFLEGTILAAGAGRARLRLGRLEIEGRMAAQAAPGGRADCAIRAEHVRLVGPGERRDVALPGEIEEVIFEGDRSVYTISVPALGGARLQVFDRDHAAEAVRQPRERVTIGWDARDVMIFPRQQ